MNKYVKALASDDICSEIFDLLSSELNVEWDSPEDEKHVSWCPGRLEHQLSISSHNNGDTYLTYICRLYSGISSASALLIASDLNRRMVGVAFVAVPIDGEWSLLAYSYVILNRDLAHVLLCYVLILKRVIGIVENIVDQNWFREIAGIQIENSPNLTDRSDTQNGGDFSAFLDPLKPVFATGLWVSDKEANEFHRRMKSIVNESNAGFGYVSMIENSEVSVLNDLKLESKYIVIPERSLKVFRDYDVLVEIKNVRHRELGWGLQEVQQFAYFASDSESYDGFGTGQAHELANMLNFLTFKDLSDPARGLPPFLLVGAWTAVNEQVFHGQFIPDVVLEELSEHLVGEFGGALADLVHPLNAQIRTNRFINYLEKNNLVSQREPKPYIDAWSGCNETLFGLGSLLLNTDEEMQSDNNLASNVCIPVFIQLATWGFFGGSEVPVSSLEVVKHPKESLFWLRYTVRHPHDPGGILLSGPTSDVDDLDIAARIEDWFQKLGWPRIDWLIIQSPIADEPVRNGLRHFANSLSEASNVELIFSQINNSLSPWDYLIGAKVENVFNENESVEAGFEWIVTRPDVVDKSISRIRAMFEYSRAKKSGASDVYLSYVQTIFEFMLAIRKGEIDMRMSYRDFLDERFETDSETIDQLVAIEKQQNLN